MQDFHHIFVGVEEPRRRNATRRDLHDMLMIVLLSTPCGDEGCINMALFGHSKEGFLRRFLGFEHNIPSHDAFSDLFNVIDPDGLGAALLRLVGDWVVRRGEGAVAFDGKASRRSFADAAERSPLHLVLAFTSGAGMVLGHGGNLQQVPWRHRDPKSPAVPRRQLLQEDHD